MREVLLANRHIAVVGFSKNPSKSAHSVPRAMRGRGWNVIPVNPSATEILGMTAYPDLRSVPDPYTVVNIFRPSAAVPAIVDAALGDGRATVIWMQLGIVNEEAAAEARTAGLIVVQNRCMMLDAARLLGPGRGPRS